MNTNGFSRVAFLALLAGSGLMGCTSTDGASKAADGGPNVDGTGSRGTDGSSGADGTGGASGGRGSVVADASDCDVSLAPSRDDLGTIQTALDTKVKSGNVVCFAPGTYKLKNHLVLGAAANVTMRGTGAKRDDVTFDFTGQTDGEEGVLITTDGFTIENLSIKNTAGNGIKVQATNSIFRNIKVGWEGTIAPSDEGPTNGAYAIYPTTCEHTLMEDNEVYGASDAGIYAGQCKHVIARRNVAHHNVLGIEIENSISVDLYDNDVHDNTTGFLLDLLPKLQQKEALDYLVHDNDVHDNNLPNFAKKNTLANTAEPGTGVLVLAPKNIEVTNNKISNHDGAAVLIISYDLIDILATLAGGTAEPPDPTTNRWPTNIFVHDNVYKDNGRHPGGAYAIFAVGPDAGPKTVPYNVLWDGVLGPTTADDAAAHICLGTAEQGAFLNFHATSLAALVDPSQWTTDAKAHQCTLPSVPPLTP